ncbi:septum formation initiator family protein [Acidimicrobiia bacterium EGI L10123]|uniref:FtsB family cell division protein n=1 Tax=Salinilacustrithrix flava TaxID=2957203 RepID=UPI003D7C2925|nr:septum formation initiator family protein [Acidimicrobiia bacterium EGI L10123]
MTAATTASRAGLRRPHLPSGIGRWIRPLLLATAAVVTIAALAVYVFPTRTWLDQRAALAETSVELRELQAERSALEQRVAELDSDGQIEEIARSQYGLVRPGEEAYAVLPAPEQPVELPALWPFGALLEPTAPEGSAPSGGATARD